MPKSHSNRIIFHVDMDAFFASIEQRNNPELRGQPVIVCSEPRKRGVVATCSYEARKFGIHSAMPTAQAMKLCPNGYFVPGDFFSYDDAAIKVRSIFKRFTPKVEAVSIDEAFLDLSGSIKMYGSPIEAAKKIKAAIKRELGITCTVGIGPNKLVAKLASGLNKPDGLNIIKSNEIETKLYPLSVDKIWGVGPVTYELFKKCGIFTIGDLARLDPQSLKKKLGEFGKVISDRAHFLDEHEVLDEWSQPDEKSISHEYTIDHDTDDLDFINSMLLYLAEKVAIRMQRGHWLSKTIALRLRYADFKTITRQDTFDNPTDDLKIIYQTVRDLVPTKHVHTKRVRLVGVRVSHLVKESEINQVDLFSDRDIVKKKEMDFALKKLRDKFGRVSSPTLGL